MTPPARRIATTAAASLLALNLLLAGCAGIGPGPAPAGANPAGAPTDAPLASADTKPAAGIESPAAPDAESAPAPAPIPVDPLEPEVALNLDDRAAQTDLWARVRQGFAIPDLESDRVRTSEQWYATRPDYVQRMTERGSRYLFHIVQELERRAMPTELALLPFIESAFNPQAMSTAKASGMWQFVPATGRDFALKQNIFRDERRDVLASTRAALDYLQKLYAMFGDWQLALAAYNCGEGNVARAIARNQGAGLPTDYASLKLPAETQYYLPKLQAVKNIVARPGDFGLTLPPVANHPYFLSVPIERDIDVALAARLAGLTPDEFQTLNPQMNKPVILAAGTPQVLLPYDNAARFVHALPRQRGPLASWTAWTTARTMRPSEAAAQVGMSEAELRQVNKIPPRMLVKAGSTLLVPRGEHRQGDVPSHIADNAVMALAPDVPPLRRLQLKAGRKDSVATFARRHGVSALQLARWNDVAPAASFKPGQSVVVYIVAKPARSQAARTAALSRKHATRPATRAAVAKPTLPVAKT